MKINKHRLSVGAGIILALLVSGCETDGGVSTRAQEKSAVYASLKVWQKRLIDKASISQGFTADMVYIAMGRPDRIETKELPEGHAELWTYRQFYPNVDAIHGFRREEFSTESAYQPQRAVEQTKAGYYANDLGSPKVPMGMDRAGGESIAKTGGPQGGSMEPATLRSYTVKVLFAGAKVVRIGAEENPN